MAALADAIGRLVQTLDAGAPEGLDAGAASALVGISRRMWHDLDTRGLCPQAIQVGDSGRCPRWSRAELLAWFRAGAPSRAVWRVTRDGALRKTG